MLGHVIHDHTLHKTLHQIYIFLSETGMQSEKGVLHPIKASERPSGRKKVIQTDRNFQGFSNPNQLGIRGVSPIR